MFEFFDYIRDWLESGVYGFFTELVAYFIEAATLGYINFLKVVIPFAWGVAKVIIQDLNISALIDQAWSDLPDKSRALLTVMKMPEIINTVISGAVTKYVLKFIPGV